MYLAEESANKNNEMIKKLPELLSPAGSPAAMLAAINAGADAVYFGMPEFNARIGADNFTRENLGEYLRICHLLGVKAYITLNTQIYDREREAFLETARFAYEAGADAAIVGDLGAAALLREHLPSFDIHASTQLSGHNFTSGAELSRLGFSRMVCAREMSLDDIKEFTAKSPIEAEIFIHGALCVCHSGQCLFSSLVGGRSGNRGLCAQPCRLPYKVGRRYEGASEADGKGSAARTEYPLSLKDACLAAYIPEIIESGVASLKIEGRMKAADYVGRVTAVYRRLLDERRRATREELDYLAEVFSRGGFTDRYFTGELAGDMLGIRSDSDKESTKRLSTADSGYATDRRRQIRLRAEINRGVPMRLTAITEGVDPVTVEGEIPLEAQNRPTDKALAEKNLLKLGSTRFVCHEIETEIDEGLMVPVSVLNSLRRAATDGLESAILSPYLGRKAGGVCPLKSKTEAEGKRSGAIKVAIFTELSQIPRTAYSYFDRIFLPATEFVRHSADALSGVSGVELPSVIFDSEKEKVREMLLAARGAGVRYALVGNLGHISLALELGFELCGGSRLNVSNVDSAASVASLGFGDVILHPELSLPKCRDVARDSGIGCLAVVYGRVPLMVVEKCVICESLPRKKGELCPLIKNDKGAVCRGSLTDRTGAIFPVVREFSHRNVIYNSVPVYMADKKSDLDRAATLGRVFIFSDETSEKAAQVIKAFETASAASGRIRRMGVQ